MEVYKRAIAACLTARLTKSLADIVDLLRTPPEPDLGDYAFPCFSLAKEWRQSPQQIAAALAAEVKVEAPIAAVTAAAMGALDVN